MTSCLCWFVENSPDMLFMPFNSASENPGCYLTSRIGVAHTSDRSVLRIRNVLTS